MNCQKTRTSVFVLILLAASMLLAACSSSTPVAPTPVPPTPTASPVDMAKAYVAAVNKHDIQGVSDLVTDDIIYSYIQQHATVAQRQKVLGYHSAEFGKNFVFQLGDCQASGDTVTCPATYTQDCLMGGVKLIHSQLVFTVINNKFSKILQNDQEDEARISNNSFLLDFIPWYMQTYPDEVPASPEAAYTFDYGVAFGKRCKEFNAIK